MNIMVLGMICSSMVLAASAPPVEAFTATNIAGEFRVNTGALEGNLRLGGLSFGFSPFRHVPTDTDLITIMGLLNYYRVFTTNHRYGEAMRSLPSEATLGGTDTVRVYWPADEDRPFSMTGIYHWVAPDTVDLETIVSAKETLPEFDVFIASYMSAAFPATSIYVKADKRKKEFMTAEPEHGVWQAFPRDADAVRIIKDGRWDIEPSPVDWAIRPELAAPIVYRRAEETGVVIAMMARPEDCFAVFTPDRGEGHYSMYLSLFGKTLEAGETARARIRMVIGVLDDDALLKRYKEFIKSFDESHARRPYKPSNCRVCPRRTLIKRASRN